MKQMKRLTCSLASLGALALTAAATPAQAAENCYTAPASWNAPNGAVVFSRGESGPITPVIDAVGEYRTHSILSHGPGGGASHATMGTPDMRPWPDVCTLALKAEQLRNGYPGLEQVNQGGIYSYMYGNKSHTTATHWVAWQLGDATRAATVADAMWYNHPYAADLSRFDSSQYVDRPLRNGARVNYSLFQYRDQEQVHQMPSTSVNNGMVCSTFLSYAHAYGGQGVVSAYTYNHSQLATASNSLYNTVVSDCRNHVGFWGGLLITVACPFTDVCARAGSQVTNCMSANRCDTADGNIWRGIRDNPSTTATSTSPDRIGGWGVHPITTTLWGPDYSHQLQWNSGGNVYGCWQ
jgi:hypothetical protein